MNKNYYICKNECLFADSKSCLFSLPVIVDKINVVHAYSMPDTLVTFCSHPEINSYITLHKIKEECVSVWP